MRKENIYFNDKVYFSLIQMITYSKYFEISDDLLLTVIKIVKIVKNVII